MNILIDRRKVLSPMLISFTPNNSCAILIFFPFYRWGNIIRDR